MLLLLFREPEVGGGGVIKKILLGVALPKCPARYSFITKYKTVRIASTERTPFLNHCNEILRFKHYQKSGLLRN